MIIGKIHFLFGEVSKVKTGDKTIMKVPIQCNTSIRVRKSRKTSPFENTKRFILKRYPMAKSHPLLRPLFYTEGVPNQFVEINSKKR